MTVPWDTIEKSGGWATNNNATFTFPASGYYYVTASLTVISPATPELADTRLSFTAWCSTVDSERTEWLRSGNNTAVASIPLTCTLRGIAYAAQGQRLSFTVETRTAEAKPWTTPTVQPGSPPLSMFSAVLVSPGAMHS
ncbi:hypothetical protein ACIBCO_22120 [Streptomyces violascens]|uniref:hypothetical protein n=1 Tax=Streptomyces violascens TaxID=67381 RepID=UPI0037A7B187